ncbi:MAG: hypothetical protein ACRDI1_05310 [Actinomycetota bacterium]
MRIEELERKSPPAQPEVPKKSWPWLLAAFVLCPCHIPILLAILGTGALGGALAPSQGVLFVVLGAAFALALWRYLATPKEVETCPACMERDSTR